VKDSLKMPQDERAFDNPFVAKEPKTFEVAGQVCPINFQERVKKFVFKMVPKVFENLENGNISLRDASVYTGLSGIALMLIKLQKSNIMSEAVNKSPYEWAYQITKKNNSKKLSGPTLLCGTPGAIYVQLLAESVARNRTSSTLFQTIFATGANLFQLSTGTYDEYLYGRIGYLGCLVAIARTFPQYKDEVLMDKICKAVIENGLRGSVRKKLNQPMYFEWHDSEYVGGAHGYAGIFYYLLKLRHLPSVQSVLNKELKSALYWFLGLQMKGGNYPSSIGSGRDKLVHWCHGAPSAVFTLITAFEVYGDEQFRKAALECGECVWKRGFLKKGYYICHGTAGNAYTFLALYRLTKDVKQLYRAYCFAELCLAFDQPHRSPDRPYSLFEGLAGTIYFLVDMLDVDNARFPCYEIDS